LIKNEGFMLHIILTILKIIGIVLLVLFVLVLLSLAAVLFIPVRYRVNGEKDEKTLLIKAEAFWFMHLLHVKALYPEPGRVTVKLFRFMLYDSAEEPKMKKEKKKQRKKKEHAEDVGLEKEKKKIKENKIESIEKTQEQQTDRQKTKEFGENLLEDGKETENTKGKIVGFFEKIKGILRKIKNAIENIWYTIKRLCDRIVKIRDDISYYIEVIGEEETKQAFLLCKKELNRIWKNIRPSRCRAEFVVGTGEPDTTGYILAIHGILYPIIGNDIIVEPDFDHQVLEGKFFLKGRVTVFVLLYAVIKIYFDKNIRYFLKRFKREEA